MPFQLVVITPDTSLSSPAAAELRVAQSLLDRGLQVLHVRKPGSSAEQVQQYLTALPPAARRRCQLHQHHSLAKQTAIHGVPYREADRPPGIIKAPPGLAGVCGPGTGKPPHWPTLAPPATGLWSAAAQSPIPLPRPAVSTGLPVFRS